jgi:HTH-type transcriptional regulator/antitoxin HigA
MKEGQALAIPKYDELLHEIQPRSPRNKQDNQRLLAEIEKLMKKGEGKGNLSPAEEAMLDMLVTLVSEYERRAYPRKKSTPAETLAFLMEQNNLTSTKLPLPANRVSEILSGKREVSKEQAKSLGEFFHVSPALFI